MSNLVSPCSLSLSARATVVAISWAVVLWVLTCSSSFVVLVLRKAEITRLRLGPLDRTMSKSSSCTISTCDISESTARVSLFRQSCLLRLNTRRSSRMAMEVSDKPCAISTMSTGESSRPPTKSNNARERAVPATDMPVRPSMIDVGSIDSNACDLGDGVEEFQGVGRSSQEINAGWWRGSCGSSCEPASWLRTRLAAPTRVGQPRQLTVRCTV